MTLLRQGTGPWWRLWLLALVMALLGGCASGPRAHPDDPLEPFNRSMY
jgi:ABC-type transporter lipoprotein component MlaA